MSCPAEVNADTEKKERNDCMGCRIEESEHGAEPIAEYHTHGNTGKWPESQ